MVIKRLSLQYKLLECHGFAGDPIRPNYHSNIQLNLELANVFQINHSPRVQTSKKLFSKNKNKRRRVSSSQCFFNLSQTRLYYISSVKDKII
jgi:hypothetical protein